MKKTTKTKLIIVGALLVAATVTAIVCGTVRRHGGKDADKQSNSYGCCKNV